jgi:diacylglycerol kinase (ATP)
MRASFIYNPAAGLHFAEPDIAETLRFLQAENVEITSARAIVGPNDSTLFAREAAEQHCDVLFLSGGDGTIARAAEGLLGSDTALAILPGGTGNVFARQLGLPVAGPLHPKPLLESTRMLLSGRVRPIDMGRVTLGSGVRRYFLAWAGVGFDAQISRTLEADPVRKKQLGPFAFALAGFLMLRDLRGTPFRLRVDGHPVNRRLLMLVANNIQLYGIIFRMAQHAVIDDGSFDTYGFRGDSSWRALLHAIRLLVNRHIDDPEVDIYRVRKLEITSTRPMPVQIDGDFIGETPVLIECLPRALRLMVPTCAPATLFADNAGLGETKETAVEWMQRMARDVQHAIRPEHY